MDGKQGLEGGILFPSGPRPGLRPTSHDVTGDYSAWAYSDPVLEGHQQAESHVIWSSGDSSVAESRLPLAH